MWEWHGFGFGHGVMWLFWVLVIVAIIAFVRHTNNGTSSPPESALDILKKRYARGEIDEEEYQRRRQTLQD